MGSSFASDTIAVRPGEELDVERLEPYLRANLPAVGGTFDVRQFGGGHANLTYLVRFGEDEFVLRRPPPGPLPKGGHDMRREFRVLSVLHGEFALAPRAYAFCDDPAILGVDFVVMERRRGIVIRGVLPPALAGDPAACARLGEGFVETLGALHAVDYARLGLDGLGRPDGYLERQLAGWRARWEAAVTPDRGDASALIGRLAERLPASGAPALVHNDFKFDNAIVGAGDPSRLVAILDWDMATIGDPLVDLGNVLALWMEPGDPPALSSSMMPTSAPGFPTRQEIVERYARTTGRDCSRIGWYHAFNVFRYAAIAQQIYARYVRGSTSDARFAAFGRWANALLQTATSLAERGL